MVLDHHHRIALVDQLLQHVEQLARVFEVQAGGRLVEDVHGAAGAAARQLLGQLDPLRLAARQRRRRLPQRDVTEPDVLQRAQLGGDRRHVLEQGQGLVDGQFEDVGDGRPPVAHLQRLAVVAAPLALLAGHVDVGQEVHLDGLDAAPLAGLAPPALDVEREPPRPVAAGARLGQHREQPADEREEAGVGGGVRPGRPADGRLVYLDDLVHEAGAVDAPVGAGRRGGPVQVAGQRAVQDVVDERRFPGTAHAGDHREEPEGDGDVDVLEVVGARAADDERAAEGRTAGGRHGDAAFPPQVASGQRRVPVRQQLRRRPLEHHLPAVRPRPGAEVDHVVGGPNGLFVVLDDHDGVPEVAQPAQRRQQPPVVPLMQADGRFVEHVEHAGEAGTDLGGEPDPLPFPPRQGGRAARQGQIADADVGEEPQPVADLAQHAAGDQLFALGEFEGRQRRVRLGQRQPGVIGERAPLHAHRPARGPQAVSAAGGARLQRTEGLEGLLLVPGPRLVTPLQVRQDALEVAPERFAPGAPPAALRRPLRGGRRTVQQGVAVPPGQPLERRVEIDAEMPAQPGEGLPDELGIAVGPRRDGPLV